MAVTSRPVVAVKMILPAAAVSNAPSMAAQPRCRMAMRL
jgi:hypothetical protein